MVDVSAADVLDLTRAKHCLTGLVACLQESGNVGGIGAEDISVEFGDLFETVKAGEEGTPEH